jgi:50S ribosomal subunit-associated GTPase HflX
VIDASKPADEQWTAIDAELAAYGAGLDELPQIVVLNKIDLEPDPSFGVADERIVAVFQLSCATGKGIDEFRKALFTLVPEPEPVEVDRSAIVDYLVYRPEPKARPWSLLRTEGGFRVVGKPPSEEALERALREAGAKRGADVQVGEESFEFVP